MDNIMDWALGEEDDLMRLLKLFVVTLALMVVIATAPVWMFPYLLYKALT